MNLVRWFRKNNKKVMAVVVIVIMFGFVGGSYISKLGQRSSGLNQTTAYFGEKGKITNYDLYLARQELDILRMLRADALLRSQDLQGVLLGELLFTDQRASLALINRLKRTIRTNQYQISDKQINDIYRRQMPPNIYWHCLQKEAQLAGIRVSNKEVGTLLGEIIPQLFNGQTYSQLIGAIINRERIPEEQILTTLGKLLAVVQYAKMICSNENVTTRQIMHSAKLEEEGINVDFVQFDSADFISGIEPPASNAEQEHFEKYKKLLAGDVSDENPYGFGYKLPDRVQLEYIAVRLADIRKIVTPPTQDEVGEYYNRQKEEQFTEELPADPNDPNSPPKQRIKSFAEVAGTIREELYNNKINSMAERILQDAKTLTEASLQDMNDAELAKLNPEQFAKMAGDYKTTARQLSEKHNIKVYVGQTGLLSPMDMQTDEILARLYLRNYGRNPIGLTQIVFAVDELAVSELGPFDVAKPRQFENIGPANDLLELQDSQDVSEQITALVRVIKAIKASEPESIDQTFSTKTLVFDPNQEEASEDIFSVKENVAKSLKRLAAMETTKSKAEEFVEMAAKDGWDNTIDKFNELYGQNEKQDDNEPNAFDLQSIPRMQRISKATLETIAVQSRGNPAASFFLNESRKNQQFADLLYSLIPPDSNTVEALPVVMEFKPDMSYYVIKNISVKPFWKEDFEKIKALRLYREDHIQSQSMAVVHFSPENILKRMNFRLAEADEESADANKSAESEEDS